MAQIDIGKIKPVFRGSYDNSTAYVLDDIVYYNGSSYVAKTSTTGNLPTDNTKWNVLASGSGGIYDGTLSLGSANQILQVNSGGTALEFTSKPEGKLKQLVHAYDDTRHSINTTVSSFTDVSGISLTITPTSASNKILLQGQFNFRSHDQYAYHRIVRRVGGSDAIPTGWVGASSGSRIQTMFGNMYRYFGESDTNTNGNVAFSFLDTDHNTTNAITYALQFRFSTGSYYASWGNSHSDSNSNTSGRAPRFNWTAMEIA
jgi:hypothetical protein